MVKPMVALPQVQTSNLNDSGFFSPKRVSSPIGCLSVLLGKTLGESAEDYFGHDFCATIKETSTAEAVVGLFPVLGRIALDCWHDAQQGDLETILKLIEESRQDGRMEDLFTYQLEAASLGHVNSMIEVGKAYQSQMDTVSARQWFAKALVHHHPLAYFNLYMLCKKIEPEYAATLLAKSKDLGHLEIILDLLSKAETFEDRFDFTLYAAALGDVPSMITIGLTYADQRDIPAARKWLEKAASLNDSIASYELYLLFKNTDFETAFYALNNAAEAGHRQAVQTLVQLYENGNGTIVPNSLLADKWRAKPTTSPNNSYISLSSSLVLPEL